MISQDVLQYLKDNFYIIPTDGGYVVSNKFTRELGVVVPKSASNRPANTKLSPVDKDLYKLFIQEANVPTKIETSSGAYWANRYSDAGFKAFKKVMENPDINRAILLQSTKWYYAQVRTARKMIGTYFSEGIWESNYDDFVKAIQQKKDSGGTIKPITSVKIVDENASNMEVG